MGYYGEETEAKTVLETMVEEVEGVAAERMVGEVMVVGMAKAIAVVKMGELAVERTAGRLAEGA